jgi:hypothetical protein
MWIFLILILIILFLLIGGGNDFYELKMPADDFIYSLIEHGGNKFTMCAEKITPENEDFWDNYSLCSVLENRGIHGSAMEHVNTGARFFEESVRVGSRLNKQYAIVYIVDGIVTEPAYKSNIVGFKKLEKSHTIELEGYVTKTRNMAIIKNKIIMCVTAFSGENIPFTSHMGIFKTINYVTNLNKKTAGMSMLLHSFGAAMFEKLFNCKKAYMATKPAPVMFKIIKKALKPENIHVGDKDWYKYLSEQNNLLKLPEQIKEFKKCFPEFADIPEEPDFLKKTNETIKMGLKEKIKPNLENIKDITDIFHFYKKLAGKEKEYFERMFIDIMEEDIPDADNPEKFKKKFLKSHESVDFKDVIDSFVTFPANMVSYSDQDIKKFENNIEGAKSIINHYMDLLSGLYSSVDEIPEPILEINENADWSMMMPGGEIKKFAPNNILTKIYVPMAGLWSIADLQALQNLYPWKKNDL